MRHLLLIVFLFTGSDFLHSQTFDFWGDLQAGPYPVGFSVENHYDTGRNFRQLKNQDTLSIHRPIQLALWYPAVSGKNKEKVTVGDYLVMEFNEHDFERRYDLEEKKEKLFEKMGRHGASRSGLEKIVSSPTKANKRMLPAKGPFPLIIFVQGGGRPAHSAFLLCEYLASYGFVVATMPAVGSQSWAKDRGMDQVLLQKNDIAFIRSLLIKRAYVGNSLGLISFSTGAHPLTLYQMQHQNAQLAVLLDGAPSQDFLHASPVFDPTAFTLPSVFIQSNHGKKLNVQEAQLKEDPLPFLPYCDKYFLRMMDLNHPELLTIGMLQAISGERLIRFDPVGDIQKSHELLCRQILIYCRFFLSNQEKDQNAIPRLGNQKEIVFKIFKAGH